MVVAGSRPKQFKVENRCCRSLYVVVAVREDCIGFGEERGVMIEIEILSYVIL